MSEKPIYEVGQVILCDVTSEILRNSNPCSADSCIKTQVIEIIIARDFGGVAFRVSTDVRQESELFIGNFRYTLVADDFTDKAVLAFDTMYRNSRGTPTERADAARWLVRSMIGTWVAKFTVKAVVPITRRTTEQKAATKAKKAMLKKERELAGIVSQTTRAPKLSRFNDRLKEAA